MEDKIIRGETGFKIAFQINEDPTEKGFYTRLVGSRVQKIFLLFFLFFPPQSAPSVCLLHACSLVTSIYLSLQVTESSKQGCLAHLNDISEAYFLHLYHINFEYQRLNTCYITLYVLLLEYMWTLLIYKCDSHFPRKFRKLFNNEIVSLFSF